MRARWVRHIPISDPNLMSQIAGWWPTTYYTVCTSFTDSSKGLAALTKKINPDYGDHYTTVVWECDRNLGLKHAPGKFLYEREYADLTDATRGHNIIVETLNRCMWCRWTLYLARRGRVPLAI